jgi:hypothetical protein
VVLLLFLVGFLTSLLRQAEDFVFENFEAGLQGFGEHGATPLGGKYKPSSMRVRIVDF